MKLKTEFYDAENDIPGFMYLFAHGRDAKSRILIAKKLYHLALLRIIYGAFDGLNFSLTLLKYIFDLLFADSKISSLDAMREWMSSQEGASTAAASSVALILLSMLANYYNEADEKFFKRYMAVLWFYGREIKGLKDAYRGVRSTFLVFELLGMSDKDLRHLITPIGLFLGGGLVLNRIWFRSRIEQPRKEMLKSNALLLGKIEASELLSRQKIAKNQAKIQSESSTLEAAGLLSAAYDGIVDGLYLHIGTLSACSLSLAPIVLQAMSIFCVIYLIACVATRVNEEWKKQQQLLLIQERIELALYGKEIGLLVNELVLFGEYLASEASENELIAINKDGHTQQETVQALIKAVSNFKKKRDEVCSLSSVSYVNAVLSGLGNGLAVYSVFATATYAIANLLMLASIALPPYLLVGCITLGMVCLIGSTIQSIMTVQQYQAEQQLEVHFDNAIPEVLQILTEIKDKKKLACEALQLEKVKQTIASGYKINTFPSSFSQAFYSEVWRIFFSAIVKGIKAMGFIFLALQEVDENGNYHDRPRVVILMILSAFFHAMVFALLAYARIFSSLPIDEIKNEKKDLTDSILISEPVHGVYEDKNEENQVELNDPVSQVAEKLDHSIIEDSIVKKSQDKTRYKSWLGFFGSRKKLFSSDALEKVIEDSPPVFVPPPLLRTQSLDNFFKVPAHQSNSVSREHSDNLVM